MTCGPTSVRCGAASAPSRYGARVLSARLTPFALAALACLFAACDRHKPEPSPPPTSPPAPAAPFDPGSLGVAQPSPERLVAIGDLHGDLDATRRAFRLAGAIDDKDAWIGGKLVVVQTGDAIDRGDDDRAILDLLEKLKGEAEKAGGKLVALSGNHEIMNASFDFRYVTEGSFKSFRDVSSSAFAAPGVSESQRGRAAAFAPGGAYATMIASRPLVARVGDSIFVHGGVLPKHVRYGLDRINDGTRKWLLKQASSPPAVVNAEDGPLWTRMYSAAPGREECKALEEALELLHAKRMVMGHTVQKPGIQPACDKRAWRIDVGLARYYGGPTQVLEIKGDEVKVLDAAK
ncbi:MAG: metallophosphoesterase [Myxococcales bacterium]|nr:metallophosphoesterase [Myxococcales bacterium]